jgi:hypothetical protein
MNAAETPIGNIREADIPLRLIREAENHVRLIREAENHVRLIREAENHVRFIREAENHVRFIREAENAVHTIFHPDSHEIFHTHKPIRTFRDRCDHLLHNHRRRVFSFHIGSDHAPGLSGR